MTLRDKESVMAEARIKASSTGRREEGPFIRPEVRVLLMILRTLLEIRDLLRR